MGGAYLIILLTMGISWLIQYRLKSKFEKFSQTPLRSGLSGSEIAERMLHDNGIYDVRVVSVEGHLSDHYNPLNKTVNLSYAVYHGRNAAAAAVASHECGHAVQHARAYPWLTMRSTLVPVVSVASNLVQYILMAGVLLLQVFPMLLGIGIILFALTTLFAFITLPVEFDASKRALAWIDSRGVVTREEHAMSKNALKWAALTYVVAAIGSLATLLYYVSMFLGVRRNDD